jgi:hypothetical protein
MVLIHVLHAPTGILNPPQCQLLPSRSNAPDKSEDKERSNT